MRQPQRGNPRTKQQQRRSCLVPIIVGMVGLLLVCGAYVLFMRPFVSGYVAQEYLEGQVDALLPPAIAAMPAGEHTLDEQQINAYLAAEQPSLEPLESATIHFVPGQVQADITAYGVPNHITLGLAVVDGQIVVVDPHLSGPLEMMISFDDMVRVLESQLNEQMQQAGRTMHDIRIEPGRMVVVVE